ncbi:hypothetical protein OH77DRAFT_1513686 [Trametes cingulata]|nr:hypothetical protein OH77DRAFT_1513686 [Trametes cingulata]
MELLDLPDDVLILILSHLHGKDALHAALTARRLAPLALPRVAAAVQCWKPSMLRRLHAFLLSPARFTFGSRDGRQQGEEDGEDTEAPLRATYLQKLTIEVHTFGEYDSEASEKGAGADRGGVPGGQGDVDRDGVGAGDGEENQDEGEDADEQYYAADFSQVRLIGDILVHAPNLQELSLERFAPCTQRDARIGAALRSMTRLANVRLATLGDGALAALRACPADVRRLTLSYFVADEYPLPGERKTLPPLLAALAAFPRLRVVKLWNFTPACPDDDGYAAPTPPVFPSVRYLRLSEAAPPALELVGLCPNVSTLIYSRDVQEVPDSDGAAAPRAGPAWPPLERLMLGEHEDAADVLGRLSRVERLHVSGELRVPTHDGEELERFLALLRVTSPVELYLSVLVRATPMTFWGEVVGSAPRLRVLELKVSIPAPSLQYDGWLDDIPDALRPLSLQCLRVYLPRLGYPPSTLFQFGALHNPAEDSARRAAAREMELRRAKSVRTLPQKLAEALPSLRYLALLDEGQNRDNLSGDDVREDEQEGEGEGEGEGVYEWDELRRTDYIKSNRWWRVVDGAGGGGRALESISVEEGERAQEEIIESGRGDVGEGLAERVQELLKLQDQPFASAVQLQLVRLIVMELGVFGSKRGSKDGGATMSRLEGAHTRRASAAPPWSTLPSMLPTFEFTVEFLRRASRFKAFVQECLWDLEWQSPRFGRGVGMHMGLEGVGPHGSKALIPGASRVGDDGPLVTLDMDS